MRSPTRGSGAASPPHTASSSATSGARAAGSRNDARHTPATHKEITTMPSSWWHATRMVRCSPRASAKTLPRRGNGCTFPMRSSWSLIPRDGSLRLCPVGGDDGCGSVTSHFRDARPTDRPASAPALRQHVRVTTFGRRGHPVAQAPLGRATQGANDRNVPRSVGEHYGRTIPGAVLTLCEREGSLRLLQPRRWHPRRAGQR